MSTKKFTDTDLQVIIGNLLRYGVYSALSISLLGGIILLFKESDRQITFSSFTEKSNNILDVLQSISNGVLQGDGESITYFGILLLFLTPTLRLLLSLISFILEKDWLYIFISLIVIGIIALSLSLGFSH
ncbi:MAG: DUF1634 domain-containing protein [Flavobacteriaceae bacterium]|jgi:uncharacterized membrane protein|nr:DUF1634 domain-containing protein [Flavobacteriaceae bacterium]